MHKTKVGEPHLSAITQARPASLAGKIGNNKEPRRKQRGIYPKGNNPSGLSRLTACAIDDAVMKLASNATAVQTPTFDHLFIERFLLA